MNKRQAQILIDLAEFLRTMDRKHKFDIDTWQSVPPAETEEEALKYGTSCCAWGWAVLTIPAVKKRWRFKVKTDGWGDKESSLLFDNRDNWDFDDIGEFLGISGNDACYMFDRPHGPGKAAAIKRIMKVVHNHGWEAV